MYRSYIIYFTSIFILISACENQAPDADRNYPFIVTSKALVEEDYVEVKADILRDSEEEIIEYGFIWDLTDNPGLFETVPQKAGPSVSTYLLAGSPEGSGFSHKISGGLLEGKTYYCRCYARTGSTEIFGNVISFTARGSKAPLIKGFSPESAEYDTRVKIWGENFSQSIARTRVKFGVKEVSVDSIGADEIYVRVPWITCTQDVKITVEASGIEGVSEAFFEVYYPWYPDTDFTNKRPGDINYWFETGGLLYGIIPYDYAMGYTGAVWSYNPAGGNYTRLSDVPDLSDVSILDHFKIDSRVYLLALNSLWQLELWEYLASSDEWTRKTDFPGTAGKNIRATAIGSKAIISLGALYDHADIYETWEYNADTDEWRQKTDFHYLDLDDASLFTYNNTAYLCACNLDTGIKIYTYNEGQGQWNYVSDYPGRSTAGIKAFSAAGRLFFGFGRNTYSDYRIELYEYFPETNLWDRYISIDRTASGLFAFSGTEKAFVIAEEQYSQTHLMYEFIPPEADIN